MAPSEYSTPGGGGKLKLKGSKTSNGRIEKKKKKSSKKGNVEENEQQKQQEQQQLTTTTTSATASGAEEEPRADEHESSSAGTGKTEAERKYEEMRKKRLQERLKREGVKTHKERVEELNKYLSRLSEHHDIYWLAENWTGLKGVSSPVVRIGGYRITLFQARYVLVVVVATWVASTRLISDHAGMMAITWGFGFMSSIDGRCGQICIYTYDRLAM
ncbi:uncharacterized protein An08g06490 [Aspergillus niger]|uniref:Contig An08c0140, genomic contig n=2 Tax=Aspergillus niger TaxID=5061 RepID=A2QRL8_ASPNC|nr:uncharacterized protein An08g06490 [Aspergillus niger]CAK45619.1 unnamed protein product [Aspergillus niger]